jgi:hypothetical protein
VRTILAVDRAADRRWFLGGVGLFPLADYVLPVMPNQMLLVALSYLRPALWRRLAAVFVIAGGVSAFAVAAALSTFGGALLAPLGGLPDQGAAADVLDAVRTQGLWALAAIALLPTTPRIAVVACALAGLPAAGIGLAVAAGRTVPMTLLAAAGAMAPQALRRLSRVDRVMRQIDAVRARRCRPHLAVIAGRDEIATRRRPPGVDKAAGLGEQGHARTDTRTPCFNSASPPSTGPTRSGSTNS